VIVIILGCFNYFAFINFTSLKDDHIKFRKSFGIDVCGYPLPTNYSEPQGCILKALPRKEFKRPPEGVNHYDHCNFFTENFVSAYCNIEKATHDMVKTMIGPSDVVLEIGSRYASTTCEVAVMQNNSGAVIAVEPDHRVWAAAEFNKLSHNCCGWSVFGVVGEKDVQMEVTDEDDEEELDYENNLEDWKKYINKNKNKGYNKQTIDMNDGRKQSPENMVTIKHFSWNQIEDVTGLKINTVILDCEGCWTEFVELYKAKFKHQVDKIILENDNPSEEATREGLEMLETLGFSINEMLTTGHIKWMGSMFALTKDKE